MNTKQKIGVGLMGVGIVMLPIAYAVTNNDEPKIVAFYVEDSQNKDFVKPQPTSINSQGIAIERGNNPNLQVQNARIYNTQSANPINADGLGPNARPNNSQNNANYTAQSQGYGQPQYNQNNEPQYSQNFGTQVGSCDYYGGAAKVGVKHYKYPEASPSDLVTYSGRHKVHRDAIQPLRDMVAAARADGVNLEVGSAFRSVEYQRGIVQRKKQAGQSDTKIYKVSSHPGYSEHHTGFAVDFTPITHEFANTKGYRWLRNNAHNYGFYQTYTPQYSRATGVSEESWHWKFTNSPTAQQMLANSNCLGRGQPG